MKKRVYLETSVIGAYFDERTDIVSTPPNVFGHGDGGMKYDTIMSLSSARP